MENDPDPLKRLFHALGYTVLERRHDWSEVLLARDGEGWVGHGPDAAAALRAAVSQALPSYAGIRLLEAVLARNVEVPHEVAPGEVSADAVVAGDVQEEASPVEGAGMSAVVAALSEPPTPANVPVLESPSLPAVALTDHRDDVVYEELEQLRARIEGGLVSLATMAPQRQRIVILGLLAALRACQEAAPRDLRVAAGVPRLITMLRAPVAAWWPGNITAFQVSARPRDAAKDLRGLLQGEDLDTWAEVATAAQAALGRLEEREDAKGWDSEGWSDAGHLAPAPDDPDGILEDVVADLEAKGGALGADQPKKRAAPSEDALLPLARRLRWIRGSTSNPELWARAMGRLRFHAGAGGALAKALDPAHRPSGGWAALIDADAANTKSARKLEKLLADVPAGAAAKDRAAVIAWLGRVLPLTTLHAAEIAEASRPLASVLLTVKPDDIPDADRRIRRRLQKLQEAITGTNVALPTAPAGAELPASTSHVPNTLVGIAPEVLELTRGRRVLFVSNRADPDLKARLLEEFAFASVDWAEASPRRIASSDKAIRANSFDLVLGATGFLDHKTDGILTRACKAAGIPYIRVDKGRPRAVELALLRDLVARSRGAA